jgi:uncharacterized membrane protein YeaQ/YmgE (transglycosylase-associated protein family)
MTLAEFVTLLFVGLLAGWLAGVVMKGGGYGLFGDILLGIVGAVLGGVLFGMLGISAYGFLGRVVVATVGSIVLVGLARLLRGGPAPAKR